VMVSRDTNPPEPWLQHPVREARKVHDFLDWRTMILPWGAVAVLAPLGFSRSPSIVPAVAALLAGYAQLLVAVDNARLFQWAAPAVIAIAVRDPPSWGWFAAIAGLFNPYRRS
jgi:hypothetical protein